MFKAIFEGNLHIFKTSDVDMTAGQVVKLAAGNKVVVAGAGDSVVGIVAQDVKDPSIDNFKLDSVTHVANYGDKVGVYFGGGLYYTDQFTGSIVEGDKLSVGANGQLVKTVADAEVIAYADSKADAAKGEKLRIKLVI